jgi:hypothetical protein
VVSEAAADKGGPQGIAGMAANIKRGRHQTDNTEHGKRGKRDDEERDDGRDMHYKNYKAKTPHGVGHTMGIPSRKTKKTGFENWQEGEHVHAASCNDEVIHGALRRQRSLSLEGTAFTASVGGKTFAKYTNLGINHGLGASLTNLAERGDEDEDGFFTLARKRSFADPAGKKQTIDQLRNILENHKGDSRRTDEHHPSRPRRMGSKAHKSKAAVSMPCHWMQG